MSTTLQSITFHFAEAGQIPGFLDRLARNGGPLCQGLSVDAGEKAVLVELERMSALMAAYPFIRAVQGRRDWTAEFHVYDYVSGRSETWVHIQRGGEEILALHREVSADIYGDGEVLDEDLEVLVDGDPIVDAIARRLGPGGTA